MRTAKDIYDDGVRNGFIGKDIKEKGSLANLQIVVDSLEPGEEVLMGFNGILNQTSMTKNEGIFSFAVTNKRLLMGMKMAFSKDFQTLLWDNVDHLSFARHKPFTNFGCITLDTIAKPYNISMTLKPAEAVSSKLQSLFMELKDKGTQPAAAPSTASAADEILKFKELLDMGVLTQEEFDAKKKQLLGL